MVEVEVFLEEEDVMKISLKDYQMNQSMKLLE